MSRVGTIAVTQIFTSVKNWVNSKLPTKVSDLTNDSGFLTRHPSISTSSDTTSSASPSANGTFTCIDSVTRDTNGHVTKVNTKTITLPKDTTYSGMTASEATTGTSTTNRLISPKVLEDKITAKISNLVNSAPSTLDTLDELANALGDDPNFATTIATQIGNKANDNAVVHLSGNETISGTKVFKSDKLISTSGNSYRIINNSNNSSDGYGVFQRIDNGNWYLMLTAKDDALGSWASPRPAVMSLSTGVLNINGNSATATEFSANKSVTLTGDVTGTASSKGGWTVSTTLANSGVSAGTYTNVTVDAKGRVTSGNARHSYTVTSTSKAWFRLANATSSPLDTDNPPHVQFILRAYNTSLGAQYYQEWLVDAKVFGSQSGLQIFGSSGNPFQYGRILYEATTSNVTNDTKPCIDIYLNNTSQYTTNIEIIELYNTGFEFVSGNTLSVSYTPSGFESRQVAIVQSGVSNSDWANYATRTQINRSDISSDITLADTNTYRGTCLNCTNNLIVNVPSLNSGLCWFIIKNVTNDKNVTIHPTTGVTIDGSNNDIVLRPKESITILSRSSNNFVIINDNRRRTAVVGRTVAVTGATKHWFLVAETTVSFGYADIYASFKVFKASGTYQASGILSLHVRVDSTIGVSSNRQLQWEYNNDTSTLPLENFAITTTETSGDNIKVQLWYKGEGSYSSCKFVMLAEQGTSDYLDNPIWKLTRFRKSTADGDMETLDTGFTTTTYSSLMSIVNPIPAIDTCLKNNVNNSQTIKSTGITRGTAPSSTQTFGVVFTDNNGASIGNIYGQYATNKSTYVGLYAYNGTTTSNGDSESIRIGFDSSGNVFTKAPTPETSDNSTQIATTAFVKSQGYITSHQDLSNYMTLNTEQVVTAVKKFPRININTSNVKLLDTSSNSRECWYIYGKKNESDTVHSGDLMRIGVVQTQETKNYRTLFGVANPRAGNLPTSGTGVSTGNCWGAIGVEYNYDTNRAYPVCPSCSTYDLSDSNSNHIPSTFWVKSQNYINASDLSNALSSTSGNIGDIVFARAYYGAIDNLTMTTGGDSLALIRIENGNYVEDTNNQSFSGTWKFLGSTIPTVTTGNANTTCAGVWKRIA
jgi:hypothetical protein